MAFPSFGTSPPAITEYQWSYRGFTWGPSTPLEIKEVEGVDMPTVRSGDAGRPRDHGLFVGLDVMGGREITLKGDLMMRNETAFQKAWEELATATIPGGVEQEPLYASFPNYGTLATLARVRKRQIPLNIQFSLGNLADVSLMFAASDPRWYGETKQVSVSPTGLTNGVKWPWKWNLKWGGGTVAGSLSVTNEGNIETRPLLIIEGPCTNPSVANASISGTPTLSFNLTLNSGERLVLDTDMHSAILYSDPSTPGAARLYALKAGSSWFTLQPGTNLLQYLAGTGEGTLSVQYASAWVI